MQGDVTEITKCSPTERRKIIDEIAGTADFDRKINLASEQIQSVEDKVANTNILMGEIDNRIEQLKQEREVALKYKKFKDEKTELETKIQSAKYFDTQRALELVHQNILLATKTKEELTQRLKEAESKIADTQEKYNEVNAAVRAQGEEKQLEVKKTAEEKKGAIDRKSSAIAQCEKTTLDNLKAIEGYKNGIEVQKQKIEEYTLAIEAKNKELEQLNLDLKAKKEELAKIDELALKFGIKYVVNHPCYMGRAGFTGKFQQKIGKNSIIQLEWSKDFRDFYDNFDIVSKKTIPFLVDLAKYIDELEK
jgi:chromosome segregation protein